jgi:hypothetical protein
LLFLIEKEKTENERKKEQYTKVSSAKLNTKKKVLTPVEKMEPEVFLRNEVSCSAYFQKLQKIEPEDLSKKRGKLQCIFSKVTYKITSLPFHI